MSGFFPSPVQVEQRTFLETQHKGNNISRESNKKWETEDLAISHGRKLPGCVGVTYNHDTKRAYFHNKIREGNIRNSNNTDGTRKWRWHSLTIFNSSIARDIAVRCFQLPDSGDDW